MLRKPSITFSRSSVRIVWFRITCLAAVLFTPLAMTGCQPGSAEIPLVEIDESATPMPADEFWKIIDALEPPTYQPVQRRKALVDVLAKKSLDELKGFKLQYAKQFNRLNRKDIYDMFVVISSYTDAEAYLAFRDFLIASGKEACQKVIDNPESLLDLATVTTIEFDDYEFYLTPDSAIQQSTGNRRAGVAVRLDLGVEPTGEGLDLADEEMVKEKFPKLMEFIERRKRLDEKELFGG